MKKHFYVFSQLFYVKSRGEILRRTPVVFHSLSSPWKKENETRERRRRQIEIFLRSGARTFVPEVIDEHRVRRPIACANRYPFAVHRLPFVTSYEEQSTHARFTVYGYTVIRSAARWTSR